jgi:aldehyde dehydrogenase (NAD+)
MRTTVARTLSRNCVRAYSAPAAQLPQTKAFIDNQWVHSGNTFQTINPATEQVITDVTDSGASEVDQAVMSASAAFNGGEWSQLSGYERGILINKLAEAIEANRAELAMLEVLDNGKPIGEARDIDISLVVQCYRYYAGWADKITGQVTNPGGPIAKGAFGYIEREPVGVVGAVIPWNFPLLMQAWKLAPALAAGCSVVMKTAPQTPLTANRVAELIKEVGFPAGAVNILPGTDMTGKMLVEHPGLDKIAFTGSTEVGYKILETVAQSHNMKRVTLELGGKSPAIVTEDADIDSAVAITHLGLFLNQGQCCCAGSRIFVHESRYNEFVEKQAKQVEGRTNVPGWEADAGFSSHMGPQVDREQQQKILGFIESGKREGANLLVGGAAPSGAGYFVQPTLFSDVTDDMTIAKEEIFGPVMQIMKYSDDDEVLARANNTNYGLGAAVFSKDFPKARKMANGLKSGSVWINTYDAFDATLPFGGFKASGQGRELGSMGLDAYLEYKTIVVGM